MDNLLVKIRSCRHCEAKLPHGPRPIVQASPCLETHPSIGWGTRKTSPTPPFLSAPPPTGWISGQILTVSGGGIQELD